MQVHTHVVLENIPFIAKAVLIQHLFGKKSAFLAKIVPLLKAIL